MPRLPIRRSVLSLARRRNRPSILARRTAVTANIIHTRPLLPPFYQHNFFLPITRSQNRTILPRHDKTNTPPHQRALFSSLPDYYDVDDDDDSRDDGGDTSDIDSVRTMISEMTHRELLKKMDELGWSHHDVKHGNDDKESLQHHLLAYYLGDDPPPTAAETIESTTPSYEGYTVSMLKEELRTRGLPVSGRKAELLERLALYHSEKNKNTDDSDDDSGNNNVAEGDTEDSDSDYDGDPKEAVVQDDQRILTTSAYVFDKANDYRLVPQESMQHRTGDMLLSPALAIPDEADSLLDLLPYHLKKSPLLQIMDSHASANSTTGNSEVHNHNRRNLIEIVLDVGRRPTCWIGTDRHYLLPTQKEKATQLLLESKSKLAKEEGSLTPAAATATTITTATDILQPDDDDSTTTSTGQDGGHATGTGSLEATLSTCSNNDVAHAETETNDSTSTSTISTTTTSEVEHDYDDGNDDDAYLVTREDLNHVLGDLTFGEDNRAGVERSLHRISGVRNRDGQLIGATLRVGRYVPGNAVLIADLLYRTNSSILFVGPPGSAKTSILRDAARILSEDNSVVIVDTSCEIGGAGDIPHDCIGMARRMQVKNIHSQASVMVECVQNHTPSVIVIDEIGRRAEVEAALTCKERGVRVMASAHGSLPGLVRNTELCDLVGGVDVVTVGDATARRALQKGQSGSKLRAQRKGPPVFDAIIELKRGHLHEWQVVLQTQTAVDNILEYGQYDAQIRSRSPNCQDGSVIEIENVVCLADRDEIVDEQRHSNRSLSAMNNTFDTAAQESYKFDPDAVDWDMYLKRKNKTLTHCPVCQKQLKSNQGMKNHVLNSTCRHQLPQEVVTHFRRTRNQR